MKEMLEEAKRFGNIARFGYAGAEFPRAAYVRSQRRKYWGRECWSRCFQTAGQGERRRWVRG